MFSSGRFDPDPAPDETVKRQRSAAGIAISNGDRISVRLGAAVDEGTSAVADSL